MKKRILAVDILRGAMIYAVVIIHAVAHRIYQSNTDEVAKLIDNLPLIGYFIVVPFGILSFWGSLFSLLSGISIAFTLQTQYQNGIPLKQITLNRINTSFRLFLIYLIYKIFFSAQGVVNGAKDYSLITGTLESGSLAAPNLLHMLTSSTLEAMVWWNLVITGLFGINIWIKHKIKSKPQRTGNQSNLQRTGNQSNLQGTGNQSILWIFIIMGIFILLGSLLFMAFMPITSKIKQEMLSNGRYGQYFVMIRLYFGQFSIFPVMAYAMFGAGFGLMIAQERNIYAIKKFGLTIAIGLYSLFAVFLIAGYDFLQGFNQNIVPIPLEFFNLGSQMIVFLYFYQKFDYSQQPHSTEMKRWTKKMLNYSRLSLTIFILEPVVGQLMYILYVSLIGDSFIGDYSMMIVFCQSLIIFWELAVRVWAKKKFKYSFENIFGKMKIIQVSQRTKRKNQFNLLQHSNSRGIE